MYMVARGEVLRAALYARISEDSTGDGAGVERQLRDGEALAEARGWTVVGRFSDNDISALRGKHRPGYEALFAAVRRGDVDRIVVWQSSRLWRNRAERARDIDELSVRRVGVIACKGPDLDLSTAYGRAMAGLLGEFDTMESEVKSERVAAAAADRARKGKPNGGLGYGWRKDDAGAWVVHEPEAAIVREVVDRLLAGESVHGVTADLNERGITPPGAGFNLARRGRSNPAGTRWGRSSVQKIAVRPANAGLRVHHRGRPDEALLEGAWPALVPRERWERLVARRDSRAGAVSPSRPGGRRHLLSYSPVGACGVCGGVLRSHALAARKPGHSPQVVYSCVDGNHVGRSQSKVDELVGAVVVERLTRPDARAWLAGDDEAARAAADRVVSLRSQLDAAADSYAEGRITLDGLERITARLRPEIVAADRERVAHLAAVDPDVLAELAGPRSAAAWEAATVAQRHALLEALGVRVSIMPTRRGPVFRPEDVRIEWEGRA